VCLNPRKCQTADEGDQPSTAWGCPSWASAPLDDDTA
jgi:hypothetical protein